MDFEASFEAKLQEHLEAVQSAADAAKRRVADGIAGLRPPPTPEVLTTPAAQEPIPRAPRAGPAVSFDNIDDDGVSVWEDGA